MISIRNVTYKVDGTTILDDLSVDIVNQAVAIIGNNGSGKSSLARLLNGLILPDQGQVLVDHLEPAKSIKQIRRKVGFVFQNPDLQFVFPTVEEDLVFGLKNVGIVQSEIELRVKKILTHFGLERIRHQSVHSLSGGEKQLLCIASILIMQPEIVVFDEPTTLLDITNRRIVNKVIRDLNVEVVVVTHDLEFARTFDQSIVMHEGRLVFSGAASAGVDYYLNLIETAIV